jgi:hypothetical protein
VGPSKTSKHQYTTKANAKTCPEKLTVKDGQQNNRDGHRRRNPIEVLARDGLIPPGPAAQQGGACSNLIASHCEPMVTMLRRQPILDRLLVQEAGHVVNLASWTVTLDLPTAS